MLRFIVRKYAGMAVDLGCWIVMVAIRTECSGIVLFGVKDANKWEVM